MLMMYLKVTIINTDYDFCLSYTQKVLTGIKISEYLNFANISTRHLKVVESFR